MKRIELGRAAVAKEARLKGWQRVSGPTYDSFGKGMIRLIVMYDRENVFKQAKFHDMKLSPEDAPTVLPEWLAHPEVYAR